MTDFRALCAELIDWLEMTDNPPSEVTDRARTALAQPEPQGPNFGPSESDVTELFFRHIGEGSEVGFESAIAEALARWGHPAVEPVPVSEGLPGLEECDGEGQVWGWYRDGRLGFWQMRVINERPKSAWLPTHWLPHWALPVPKSEAGQ